MSHVHFVGFKDDAYNRAVQVWGRPHFIHRYWDVRAAQEVQDDDTVVFANSKDWANLHTPNPRSFDDSAVM